MLDKKAATKAKYIYKNYGLTYPEYLSIITQGCAICGCPWPHNRICIDHIHIKGYKAMKSEEKRKYVRSGLCFLCNTGIKGLEKTANGKRNRSMLRGIVRYFNEFPLKGEI